jgi:hypothetical protein
MNRYDEALPATTPPPIPLLFDPAQPSQPNPALLSGLIPAYFQFVHPSIPIVSNERVMSRYMLSTLSTPLANALAALAAPYVTKIVLCMWLTLASRYSASTPELNGVDRVAAAQAYLEQAKVP